MADLIDPSSGHVVTVADEHVEQALREGFTPAAPEQVQARAREIKYGGYAGAGAALATGALSGASLGMSDVLGAAAGYGDALRGYQEVNPELHTVGVVGGAIIGPKIPGLGAPAALAHRAGHAAEHLVGRYGGAILGGIARGGIEGALFGAGAGASEVALAKDPMNVERAAAVILHHAAVDAGIGAAFGLGAGYIKGRAAARAAEAGDAPASRLLRASEEKGANSLVDAIDWASSKVGGSERGAVNKMMRPTALGGGRTGYQVAREYEEITARQSLEAADELATAAWVPQGKISSLARKMRSAADELGALPEADARARMTETARRMAEDIVPPAGGPQAEQAMLKAHTKLVKAEDAIQRAEAAGDEGALAVARRSYSEIEEPALRLKTDLDLQKLQREEDVRNVAEVILQPRIEKAAEAAAAARDLKGLRGAGGPWNTGRLLAGVVGGSVAGGPAGAVLGAVGSALANPEALVRQLHAMDSVLGRFRSSVGGGVKGFFRRAGGVAEVAPHAAGPVERYYERQGERAARAIGRGVQAYRRRRDPLAHYQASRTEAQNIVGNPGEVHEKVHRALGPLVQANPAAAGLMAAKLREVSLFLLKRDPAGDTQLLAGPSRPNPSRAEVDMYLRRELVAKDPLAVVGLLQDRRLSREHVETVKELWPSVYQELQQNALEGMAKLAARGKQLPYQDRLQLGVLLDIVTDPSLTPAVLQQLQRGYQAAPKATQPPGNNPRKPQLAESYSLEMEKHHGQ